MKIEILGSNESYGSKVITLKAVEARDGKVHVQIPQDWNEEDITAFEFEVNRGVDYIDTVYYYGTLDTKMNSIAYAEQCVWRISIRKERRYVLNTRFEQQLLQVI